MSGCITNGCVTSALDLACSDLGDDGELLRGVASLVFDCTVGGCPGALGKAVFCDFADPWAVANCLAGVGFGCGGPYGAAAETAFNVAKCAYTIGKFASGRRRRRLGTRERRDIFKDAAAQGLFRTSDMLINYLQLQREIMGSLAIEQMQSVPFAAAFLPAVADGSELGARLSEQEYDALLALTPVAVEVTAVKEFLHRWNMTMGFWSEGILSAAAVTEATGNGTDAFSDTHFFGYHEVLDRMQQYVADTASVQRNGYNDILAAHMAAVDQFEQAMSQQRAGICAKVRIQIIQELVLTRQGFEAKLELDNGAAEALTGLELRFRIRRVGALQVDNGVFAIGEPILTTIAGSLNGNGTLEAGETGSAVWLMIARREAAPTESVQYEVGGDLIYWLDGVRVVVPLYPDTITVQPDPILFVDYFLPVHIYGNDPFTEAVEPSIPATLGMLITNVGFGNVIDMHIASSQPEIIENEKGLLVAFELIGLIKNTEAVQPSLALRLGPLAAQSTVMLRYLLTSSLQGSFRSFTATLENTNPLGDTSLSLVESVKTHELSHMVWLDDEYEDDLPDFLCNDEVDAEFIPDRVIGSHDGTQFIPVSRARFASIQEQDPLAKRATLTVMPPLVSGWTYVRHVNPLPGMELVAAEAVEEGRMLHASNAWSTRLVVHLQGSTVTHDNIHLFVWFDETTRRSIANKTFVLSFSEAEPSPTALTTTRTPSTTGTLISSVTSEASSSTAPVATTLTVATTNTDTLDSGEPNPATSGNSSSSNTIIILVVCLVIAGLVLGVILWLVVVRRRQHSSVKQGSTQGFGRERCAIERNPIYSGLLLSDMNCNAAAPADHKTAAGNDVPEFGDEGGSDQAVSCI